MIKITNSFNVDEKKVLIIVETRLLGTYFNNFHGLIKDTGVSGIDVKVGQNREQAVISFPLDPSMSSMKEINENKIAIGIDPRVMEKINKKIESFVNSALRHEYKSVEFIPLSGYPIENLQEEINEAIKCKRKFCIIKDYDEYLNGNNDGQPKYHQYMISPIDNKNEYSDVALLIHSGDIETLRKNYKPKLKLEEWC